MPLQPTHTLSALLSAPANTPCTLACKLSLHTPSRFLLRDVSGYIELESRTSRALLTQLLSSNFDGWILVIGRLVVDASDRFPFIRGSVV